MADILSDRLDVGAVLIPARPKLARLRHGAAVERPTAAMWARPPQGPGIMPSRSAGPAVAVLVPPYPARPYDDARRRLREPLKPGSGHVQPGDTSRRAHPQPLQGFGQRGRG